MKKGIESKIRVNDIILGDCRDVMKSMQNEIAKMIYMDPPFNIGKSFNIIQTGQTLLEDKGVMKEQFDDTWKWTVDTQTRYEEIINHTYEFTNTISIKLKNLFDEYFISRPSSMAYIVFLTEVIIECFRRLKQSSVLLLHCDNTEASRIERMLNGIFGENKVYRIIWERTSGRNDAVGYGDVCDVIFFCYKGDKFEWNDITFEQSRKYIKKVYNKNDEHGVYREHEILGTGVSGGESGKPWKGIDPSKIGKHGSHFATVDRDRLPKWFDTPESWEKMSVHQKLDEMLEQGLIVFNSKGNPKRKIYLNDNRGKPCVNIIRHDQISPVSSMSKENRNYPTQKPQELLELFIKQHTKEGDLVIDPFVGSGTTIFACIATGRKYIGIDQNVDAYSIIEQQLKEFSSEEVLIKTPKDIPRDISEWKSSVQEYGEYEGFRRPACFALGFTCGPKGKDRGRDGVSHIKGDDRIIVLCCTTQLNSNKISSDIGKLVSNKDVACICIFCLNTPTKECYRLAEGHGKEFVVDTDYPKIQILTASEYCKGIGFRLPERQTFSINTNDNIRMINRPDSMGILEIEENYNGVELLY